MTIEARGSVFRAKVRRQGFSLSATFPTRAEAESWRASVLLSLSRGEIPNAPTPRSVPSAIVPSDPLTLREAAREWGEGATRGVVRTRSGRRYRRGTIDTLEYRLRLHVFPYIGRLPVGTVTPGMLRRWLEELEADTSATTARLALDALRPVMRRLVEHEVILANPCTGVRPPAQGEEARPVRFLDPAEGQALRDAASADGSTRIGPFVDLALACGARRGELLALAWGPGGLDLEARSVTIAGSFNLVRQEVGPTKNGKARVVPIGSRTVARMRAHRLEVGRPADGARVFPFDPRPAWERVRAAAGLSEPLPTIHSLRHSAATWWLASGLTVHAVAELLGHSDPTLVIKRYGHALPAERSAAGDRLEAFLSEMTGG